MDSSDSPPPPALLIVSKAIPSDIQALSHAFERINELLLPTTIDSAVYNELDRVIQVYEPFRPWTVGAMDGAAARGRLDLLKKLRVGRSAGCSSKAFIGAARNNQLEVLQWLHRYYGDQSKPVKELKAAAERSHMQVIQYLRPSMRERQVGPALEAAAANGDMEVIQALLPGPILMDRVFIAAASNGHAPVVQFLLPQYNDVYAGIVLTSAAEFGHIAVMQVAIDRCSTTHIKRAVTAAAGRGQIEVVRMLLRRVAMDATAFANAMLAAVSGEHCDVLSLLLQHWSRFEATAESDGTEAGDIKLQKQLRAVRDEITLMLTRAVEKGKTSVVKVLAPKVSFPVGGLVRMTASTNRVEIMEVLLEIAQGRNWKKDRLRASLADALPRAAATGCVAMARLLVDKCGDIDTGLAFKVAVSRKYIDCVKIFAEKSSRGFKVGALVKSARKGRLEGCRRCSSSATRKPFWTPC